MGNLKAALKAVDAALDPTLASALNAPARAAQIDALSRKVFQGKLPPDLRDWFGWHDGQREPVSLDPQNNYTALSAKVALEMWTFFHDPKTECLLPRPTWLPLFANGGGDHLMYETAAKGRGALFIYWHDDADWPRQPEYASLEAWAKRVSAAQAKLAKKMKGGSAFDFGSLAYEKVNRAPTLAALEQAEVGTMFRCTFHDLYTGVWLKTGPEVWVSDGGTTYPIALQALAREVKLGKRSEMTNAAAEVQAELKGLDPTQRATLGRALARRSTQQR